MRLESMLFVKKYLVDKISLSSNIYKKILRVTTILLLQLLRAIGV